MFLDESAFDMDDNNKGFRRTSAENASRFSNNGGPGMNVHDIENDDESEGGGLPNFGSAGGIGTPSSSRARMLAQQREIQLKKRLSAIQSGGMIRSSMDSSGGNSSSNTEMSSSPPKSKGDSHFTPAVRQFSAPKAFRDTDTAAEQNSEFRLPAARKPVVHVPPTSYQASGAAGTNRRSSRFSDDEEDEEESFSLRSSGSRTPQGKNANNRNGRSSEGRQHYSDRREDDDDDDEYDRRKGRNSNLNSNSNSNTPSVTKSRQISKLNEYSDREDDNYNDNNGYRRNQRDDDYEQDNMNSNKGSGGKWEASSRGQGNGRDNDRDNGRDRLREREREISRDRGGRQGGSDFSSDSPRQSVPARTPLNLSNMRFFLTTPLPRTAGVVQCYIRRNKSGTNKLFPVYSLFLKDGDKFLMASKKRPNNKTSNYLISMCEGDLSRDGANYLGKLRSNFVGTEFQIFDNGSNPKESEADEPMNAGGVRKDLGAVMYAANVLGSRGPRKMQVAIPAVDELGCGRSSGHSGDDILTRMRDRTLRDLAYLINKPPRWNEQVGAYVLNFNGRVTMASVKNFQLVDPDEQNAVVLQFGRVAKDEFTMDMQWPITPFQAFAVTLSSFDSKIACD